MTRKDFLKVSGLTGIVLTVFPQLAFQNSSISYKELIGKGNPILYGDNYKLKKEAHTAFLQMKNDALKSDISIKIVSSFRGFDHQKRIWERKYKRYLNQGMTGADAINKIIEYSTIPGTSRHHWGTDIDIIDANVKQPKNLLSPNNFNSDGAFNSLKQWMDTHANSYGFYLVYTNEVNRKGFKYEPWHYSYQPLSASYLNAYKNINVLEMIKNEQISGSIHFSESFINKYLAENILDINPKLL